MLGHYALNSQKQKGILKFKVFFSQIFYVCAYSNIYAIYHVDLDIKFLTNILVFFLGGGGYLFKENCLAAILVYRFCVNYKPLYILFLPKLSIIFLPSSRPWTIWNMGAAAADEGLDMLEEFLMEDNEFNNN
ncbi:hypothetical protein ACJX0J_008710 [Zea mays]